MMRNINTQVYVYDDMMEISGGTTMRYTSYFDTNGGKMSGGMKPFVAKDPEIKVDQNTKNAIIVDTGIWSGKTIEPLVDTLQTRDIQTTVIAGFIKDNARKRFIEKGANVETILPLEDYSDWAEVRDLLVLFVKSGFFMGKMSSTTRDQAVPYGIFLGKYLTCYTQPAANLGIYYEAFSDVAAKLSWNFLQISSAFWIEMERLNPALTLGLLREMFPYQFALPLLKATRVSRIIYSPNDKPSEAIDNLCDMI